ncbi:MAG: hypothetical protein CMQ39_05100 [Gammaproteobacteria bacterium]|nr:hypothetical protein [Gammaproteobacteria bacterium]|tara:strand:+ start:65 stop:271 length:207 start_codon:yes stop_codon:yes gene_type:complete
MIIPWNKLSAPALDGIIEEFVLREGTEYGAIEFSLDQKKSDIKRQLETEEVQITFDINTKTCSIVPIV